MFRIQHLSFLLLLLPFLGRSQDIYTLHAYETKTGHNFGLVSLSLEYPFNTHPDSLVISERYLGVTEHNYEADNFYHLKTIYRNRFLDRLHIKETDQLFLYHLFLDTVYTFNVSDLSLVALFDYYGPSTPVSDNDYMIGFELNLKQLFSKKTGKFNTHVLVSIGTENPFQIGQVKPINWTITEDQYFPRNKSEANLSDYHIANSTHVTYKYEQDSLIYYVQTYLNAEDHLLGEWLIVLDAKTGEEKDTKFLQGPEGRRLLQINSIHEDSSFLCPVWLPTHLFRG
jgi:hypothetical protein